MQRSRHVTTLTTEPAPGPADSSDVREARLAVDPFLARTPPRSEGGPERRRTPTGQIDDRTAEQVAREAWDAVQDATPPAPDPATDTGPADAGRPSPEHTERHRRAVAIARGLQELGYPLNETLRPGPDMAAG
ncbi:hypothetical protein [Streptomyces sp. NPDC058674]|uniref:hypothetical protein n=1 Tax=Streptomyces sp. NPDC058674 TaxID=3346592 RepID=UPI00365246C2